MHTVLPNTRFTANLTGSREYYVAAADALDARHELMRSLMPVNDFILIDTEEIVLANLDPVAITAEKHREER